MSLPRAGEQYTGLLEVGANLHSPGAPRVVKALETSALSIIASGVIDAWARLSETWSAAEADRSEEESVEELAWEQASASAIVTEFCELTLAMRVEPSAQELEDLWRRCASLQAAALSDAIAEQFVCQNGEVEWRKVLRAMHVAGHFHSKGGVGEAAAMSALREAQAMLQHLATSVPQCHAQARRALALLAGEAASAETMEAPTPRPRATKPPPAAAPKAPAALAAPVVKAIRAIPKLAKPRSPLARASLRPRSPQKAPPPPPADLPLDPPEVLPREAPAWDHTSSTCASEGGEEPASSEEQDLGFHWLHRSRIDHAIPARKDPFSDLAAMTRVGVRSA